MSPGCGSFAITNDIDENDILCNACIVIHKCDDSAAGDDAPDDDSPEWEFVIEDEDEDGKCTFVFWED